jgi:dienelactone hydrolase
MRSRSDAGRAAIAAGLLGILFACGAWAADPQPLPGTQPLTVEGDVASHMIEGIDRFLSDRLHSAPTRRQSGWRRDLTSPETYATSVERDRRRLARMLGVRDARPAKVEMERVGTVDEPAIVGRSDAFEACAVRWRAFGEVHGEGLLLRPAGREPVADVVAIPDADQTPEMLAGLADGVPPASQFARRLAEAGCRVVVPVLIDRRAEPRIGPGRKDGPELTGREYVWRQAYESGRHVVGYELAKVSAAVDWLTAAGGAKRPVGVIGWGEGGMLALYAAAIDPRVDAAGVSGYFGQREGVWKEPIDRTFFGLLERFGDAEVALLVHPRALVVDPAPGPRVQIRGRGAAPGSLQDPVGVRTEWARVAATLLAESPDGGRVPVKLSMPDPKGGAGGPFASDQALGRFLAALGPIDVPPVGAPPQHLRPGFDPSVRQRRQLEELVRHSQSLIPASEAVRDEFMKRLDASPPAKYEASLQPYREKLYNDVLGRFDEPLLPLNARTRKAYDTPAFTGYEVMLDVFPDVIAYGILLLPKDLKDGERRPVVVCQHGLEGRPRETIEGNSPYYHDFAAKLAERGFITFAPQNPYVHGERFRQLSRKAAPLGKTLWSWIVPQHQQILAFLKEQPNVDPKRIAFYGLSYGGKTALRVPAVLTDYCLSICSGDFNEWVYKISSNRAPWSYLFTHEYEIYEWDLASTFNHAEMAALIAPRPFMVERGHADGVSSDEWVAYEFAKVRRLYQARLKLGDRCAIEFFDGPHTINGKGTFEFLHRHLNWEKR